VPTLQFTAVTLNYHASSAVSEVKLPGATQTRAYDRLLRPTQIQLEAGTAGSGQVLLKLAYQYDAASDILSKTTLDGPTAYQYDALSRLTAVTPPEPLQRSQTNPNGLPVENYSYDGVHNRLSSAHQPGPWVYNANHQLLNHGEGTQAVSREYDANGHTRRIRESGAEKRLTYDVAERLTQVETESGTPIGSYAYDPFGRRLKKTTASETIYFHHGEEGLLAEFDASGNPIATYGWEPQGMWGTSPVWKKEGSNTYFYSNDHLGTPQLLTDTTGQIVWKGRADAFGKTTVDAASTVTNNLRFPGQYFDAETGVHYNYFRDYEPTIGRYLQSDPIGLRGGVNRRAYVSANPIRFGDGKGLLQVQPSCSQSQQQAIRTAEGKIQQKLDEMCGGCGDYETGCIPCDRKQSLQDALSQSKVFCVDSGDVCGRGQSPGGVIWINPPGWNPAQCGCLEAVVLHELLHNIGIPGSQHKLIYGYEKSCFPGCALVPGG
jgi:RHS repeat-associated protein